MFLNIERVLKILVAIVIIGVAGFFGYNHFTSWQDRKIETALVKENKIWKIRTEVLQEEIDRLQSRLQEQREAIVPTRKLSEVFEKDLKLKDPDQKDKSCEELLAQIVAFCRYLDQKEYIASYHLKNGTFGLFREAISQVSVSFPVITGETRDLLTLMRNMAHFYRIFGKKHIKLVKEILSNESDMLEPAMSIFFSYLFDKDRCRDDVKIRLPFETLYTYSGFFLNTLGGRSYLFRRDSKLRILTSYYCVRILDRANVEKLNPHGIDIRPHLRFSILDIRGHMGLMYQQQYLSILENIEKRYSM